MSCSICDILGLLFWWCHGPCQRRICYRCVEREDVGGFELFKLDSTCKVCKAEAALS